jgi:NlpC/P60 family putative phage cell wall peptidase
MEIDIVGIARQWIGTPYVHQASLKGVGCDCLGLLRGIWRDLYGKEPEETPPYSRDWAEATGAETLYMALNRHAREINPPEIAPGDVALFRMLPRGPAKHCGIVAARCEQLTLIHARQNRRI